MKRMPSAYKRSIRIRKHRMYSPGTRQPLTYIHLRYNEQLFFLQTTIFVATINPLQ